MFTDLAYVREELHKVGHSGWQLIADRSDVPIRTIKRLAYREADVRASAVSKLAIYFRTQEKRRK